MDDSKRPERRSNRRPRAALGDVARVEPQPEAFDPAEEEDGVTLEELSQSYQRILSGAGNSTPASLTARSGESVTSSADLRPQSTQTAFDNSPASGVHTAEDTLGDPLAGIDLRQEVDLDEEYHEHQSADSALCPLTPQSIVEAILFVGRPDGDSISAAEIAGLMRGVDTSEVAACVEQLNATYAQTNRATRIVADGAGFRIQLCDDLGFIRDRFYGRVRQVKLNQAAIDCLALIAYQPGISRDKLEQQRGQPSGSLLSQLIRRQLIEMRRVVEKQQPQQKPVQRYYPTNRLLDLTGIETLDDLPQTEDLE